MTFGKRASRWLSRVAWLLSLVLATRVLMAADPPTSNAAAEWPQFRGPDGQGHATQTGLPVRWSERQNVVWKTAIPGQGWSSPVIQGNQIWLTTAVDAGKSLRAVCVDRETGNINRDVEVFRVNVPGRIHLKNGHASPTPILAGDRVFVHFGAHGTACLSTQGEIQWTVNLSYYHHHGPAASPVLVDDLLFVSCDGFTGPFYDKLQRPDASSPQFIVGLDPQTGQARWKHARQGRHSYATALAIEVNGKTQIISPGGDRVAAYDPATGHEIWWVTFTGYSLIPRPVFGNGLVYVCSGYDTPSLLAIRPDGQGDVTQSHVVWKTLKGTSLTPSPVLVGTELYQVSDVGIGSCLDAVTGKLHWMQRLGGNFSASPIAAEDRIYFTNESGVTFVVQQGPKFKKLGSNTIEGRTFASAAVAGTAIYLRSEKSLYRIEERAERLDSE